VTNQQILDNAPEGATHVDGEHDFCKEGYYYWCEGPNYGEHPEAWIPDEFIVGNRSLADIRRIVELEKERAVRDLEQQADELEKPHANTLKPFK
jgi:hypothetical protein